MLKRYRYRAYLTSEQSNHAARLFGCCRVVFNDYIAERERLRQSGLGKTVKAQQTVAQVTTEAKKTPERAWLAEVSSVALQQSVRDAQRAYSNFFDSVSGKRKGHRMGAPRFKKRSSRQSARFTKNASFKVMDTTGSKWGKVRLPGIGVVKFARSRDLPSDPTSLTLIREPDGRWFLSFVVEVETQSVTATHPGRAAGIDLGLNDLAAVAYTDGTREKIANPKYLKQAERKIARLQQSLSRKQKGSVNRAKVMSRLARAHTRVRNLRSDSLHKLAHRIVADNDIICLENLDLADMAQGNHSKSTHDAGLGLLASLMMEKAESQGRTIIQIDRWEPTSQTCPVCDLHSGKKPVTVRVWECPGCGSLLDRDWAAAVRVLIAAGLAETLNACGGDVRLTLASADPNETGTHRTEATTVRPGVGIPVL